MRACEAVYCREGRLRFDRGVASFASQSFNDNKLKLLFVARGGNRRILLESHNTEAKVFPAGNRVFAFIGAASFAWLF